MRAGDRATLDIESLTTDGLGRACSDGLELLVAGAATGDTVDVRVVARSRHRAVAWCEVERVHQRGPSFRVASCPNAAPTRGMCGGCPISHLTPEASTKTKLEQVEAALRHHQLDLGVTFSPGDSELGYRNRAHFATGRDESGHVVLGSFARRSRELAPMRNCEVLRTPLAERAQALERALTRLQVPLHPEPDGLRYVTMRADHSANTILDLVIAGHPRRWLAEWIPQLAQCADWSGISYSVNLSEGNAMRVSESVPAFGDASLIEAVGPIALRLKASTFAQLNTAVSARMYERAAEMVTSPRVIWDWYSGAGGLGLTVAAKHAATNPLLFGADSVEEGINLARENAQRAQVTAEFRVVDLGRELPRDWPDPNLVLVNPPRRGLDPPVLSGLATLRSAELVYMSCSPKAFAHDAAMLTDHGWRFSAVQAFDMLPRTTHVELIALARHH